MTDHMVWKTTEYPSDPALPPRRRYLRSVAGGLWTYRKAEALAFTLPEAHRVARQVRRPCDRTGTEPVRVRSR